jgi:lipopolysaccharide/colanic/teichoic acid biosynthesis glycosyltransferase
MPEKLQGEDWITGYRKRAIDLTVSASLLPIAAPVCALAAAAFFAESRVNPILYQPRLGRANKPTKIIKLRTMPFNCDFSDSSMGHADVRASEVGKILRKTALDEVPQILHIFMGQMSVVGPRPLVAADVERTMDLLSPAEQKDWQRARAIAKPGWLSDFGNLSRALEAKTDDYYLKRVENDCHYLETASFETDMQIVRDALGVVAASSKA